MKNLLIIMILFSSITACSDKGDDSLKMYEIKEINVLENLDENLNISIRKYKKNSNYGDYHTLVIQKFLKDKTIGVGFKKIVTDKTMNVKISDEYHYRVSEAQPERILRLPLMDTFGDSADYTITNGKLYTSHKFIKSEEFFDDIKTNIALYLSVMTRVEQEIKDKKQSWKK